MVLVGRNDDAIRIQSRQPENEMNSDGYVVLAGSLASLGKMDEAADVFYRAVPLMRFEFQEGIGMAIRKEVLHRRGALASPATRPPAGALDQTTREALDRVMKWVELEAKTQ